MTPVATITLIGMRLPDVRAGPWSDVRPVSARTPSLQNNLHFHTMSQNPNPARIIALDPMTRGFGYVIFEPPFYLAECGFARVKGDKYVGAIAQFEKLLADFGPEVVVLEDTEARGSRRHHRVRELTEALAALARERNLAVSHIARLAVVARFSSGEARATKQSIAQELVRHFPELRLKLPKPRKPWDSEHERMSIFDALALAVTHVTK